MSATTHHPPHAAHATQAVRDAQGWQGALLVCLALGAVPGAAHAHEGSLGNEMMWQACEGQSINAPCSFMNHDQDVHRGTCQSMSGALVCVRNQPIERASGAANALSHDHSHAHSINHTHDAPQAPIRTVDQERTADTQSHTAQTWRFWPWAAGGLALLVGVLGWLKVLRKPPA